MLDEKTEKEVNLGESGKFGHRSFVGQSFQFGQKKYFVQFAGPNTDMKCVTRGPFDTVDEAMAASREAGFKEAPLDGWFQVIDEDGNIGPIT